MNNPHVRLLSIVVGILVSAYLFNLILVEPALTRLDGATRRLENTNRQLQRVNVELAQESVLKQKIAGIRLELSKRDEAKIQKDLNTILGRLGRPNLKSVPEKKKTDNFSEVQYTIDGDGSISEVSKLVYELSYIKDYFKLHVKSLRSRGGGRVDFSLGGSALMAKAPVNPAPGLSGLHMPERKPESSFSGIASKNIFAPHASLVKEEKRPPPPPPRRSRREVDVKMTAIVTADNGQPEALLESQGKSLWVKKGDKFGKYTVTDVIKNTPGPDGVLRDHVILDRGKSHVTIKYGETAKLLHDDEDDDESSSR